MVKKRLNFDQPILSVRRYSLMMPSQKDDEMEIENALPLTHRLPPQRSEPKSVPVGNPGAVPFQWEQTPGQPKEHIKPLNRNCDSPPVAAKLPTNGCPKANQHHDSHQVTPSNSDNEIESVSQTGLSLDENAKDHERSKQTTEESMSFDSDHDEASFLGRTKSCLLNGSMSCSTGTDDLGADTPRILLTDPKTPGLMIDRFLSTSKAMANPKKQSAVQDQPQELKKKIVNQDKPALRYWPSFPKSYFHYNDKEGKEESDDDRDQQENLITVGCLLPRFCLKSSVYVINPVPAMSVRARLTMFRASRTQSGSSSAGSLTDTENEYTAKPVIKTQRAELEENKASLVEGICQLESCNTSTHRDRPLSLIEEKEDVGVSEDTEQTYIEGFGLHKKSFKTLQELLADEGRTNELDSGGCVEKTVNVDNVDKVENTRPSSPSTTKASGVAASREHNSEITTKPTYQMHILDSSVEDLKKLNNAVEPKLLPNADKSGDSNVVVSSTDESDRKWGTTTPKAFGVDDDSCLDSTNAETIELLAKMRAAKNAGKQLSRATTLGNSHEKYAKFPVPPPLPRSPSDSWLSRTLPSMSMKKASNRAFLSWRSNKF